jgi:hypothetical protein
VSRIRPAQTVKDSTGVDSLLNPRQIDRLGQSPGSFVRVRATPRVKENGADGSLQDAVARSEQSGFLMA